MHCISSKCCKNSLLPNLLILFELHVSVTKQKNFFSPISKLQSSLPTTKYIHTYQIVHTLNAPVKLAHSFILRPSLKFCGATTTQLYFFAASQLAMPSTTIVEISRIVVLVGKLPSHFSYFGVPNTYNRCAIKNPLKF